MYRFRSISQDINLIENVAYQKWDQVDAITLQLFCGWKWEAPAQQFTNYVDHFIEFRFE